MSAFANSCGHTIEQALDCNVPDAASLWLDAGEPDNFAPFFDFAGNKLSKVGGRPGHDRDTYSTSRPE
jgi:hypothetical protein